MSGPGEEWGRVKRVIKYVALFISQAVYKVVYIELLSSY